MNSKNAEQMNPGKLQPTLADRLLKEAVDAIDREFGTEYARKNPALTIKVLDLLMADRISNQRNRT